MHTNQPNDQHAAAAKGSTTRSQCATRLICVRVESFGVAADWRDR